MSQDHSQNHPSWDIFFRDWSYMVASRILSQAAKEECSPTVLQHHGHLPVLCLSPDLLPRRHTIILYLYCNASSVPSFSHGRSCQSSVVFFSRKFPFHGHERRSISNADGLGGSRNNFACTQIVTEHFLSQPGPSTTILNHESFSRYVNDLKRFLSTLSCR